MRRVAIAAVLLVPACADKDVDASATHEKGEACAPADHTGEPVDPGGPRCAEGLACEPAGDVDGDGEADYVCATPVEIRGLVFDALDEHPLEGALVTALDETGAPVANTAVTDAEGHYTLRVSARRDANGEVTETLRWTLFATAADYLPFPEGVRPAIPVDSTTAVDDTSDEENDEPIAKVIENAATSIAMLPLPADRRGGVTVSGTVGGEHPGGTLVVAEGSDHAPYGLADLGGRYTIFNVPPGTIIVGYRQGLSVEPATVTGDGEISGVDLPVVVEGLDALPPVSGSVNIVDAPGGSATSVVLVPVSVFNEALERGPVPFGMRAPAPPEAPTVTSGFSIPGIPPGRYKVLAAFENDDLVRDPDMGIAGTTIQEITVADDAVSVSESFKVTEALEVVSPGAESPEIVTSAPVLEWADDASEDRYEVVVYDAYGQLVWEDRAVPRVTGSSTVKVQYGGPLQPGMVYQFRATSFRDMGGGSAISRTEDLRGVFEVAAD